MKIKAKAWGGGGSIAVEGEGPRETQVGTGFWELEHETIQPGYRWGGVLWLWGAAPGAVRAVRAVSVAGLTGSTWLGQSCSGGHCHKV